MYLHAHPIYHYGRKWIITFSQDRDHDDIIRKYNINITLSVSVWFHQARRRPRKLSSEYHFHIFFYLLPGPWDYTFYIFLFTFILSQLVGIIFYSASVSGMIDKTRIMQRFSCLWREKSKTLYFSRQSSPLLWIIF